MQQKKWGMVLKIQMPNYLSLIAEQRLPWLAFLIFLVLLFPMYAIFPGFLLNHFDGMSIYGQVESIRHWGGSFFGPTFTPMEGMYQIMHPGNMFFLPSLYPYFIFDDPNIAILLSYAIFAGILYGSSYWLFRVLGARPLVAMGAAWLTFFLCANLHSAQSVSIQPTTIYHTNLLLTLLLIIGRGSFAKNVLAILGLLLLTLVFISADTSMAPLAGPTLCIFGIAALWSSESRAELFWKSYAILATIAFTLVLYLDYALTLFSYSARIQLSKLMEKTSLGIMALPLSPYYEPVFYFLVAYVGILLLTFLPRHLQIPKAIKAFSIGALASIVLWCIFGFVYQQGFLGRAVPQPFYFNPPTYPILCLFIAEGLVLVSKRKDIFLSTAYIVRIALFGVISFVVLRILGGLPWLILLVMGSGVYIFAFYASRINNSWGYWLSIGSVFVWVGLQNPIANQGQKYSRNAEQRLNLASNGVEEYLLSVAKIVPDQPFRGYVDTNYKVSTPSTSTMHYLLDSSYENIRLFSNPLQAFSLHRIGIPTLSQYSFWVAPDLLYLLTKLLGKKDMVQYNNVSVITKSDTKILSLLGVRYLVTSSGHETPTAGAKLTFELSPISVFELDRPNLFSYSPTLPIVLTDFASSTDQLSRASFDPRTHFIVYRPLEAAPNLTPATETFATFTKTGLRFRAKSTGWSVVIMPLSFSRCLRLVGDGPRGEGNEATLFRTNVAMTGILFKNSVDTEIVMNYGPFRETQCRREDRYEVQKLLGTI